jgi:hypothetical protein
MDAAAASPATRNARRNRKRGLPMFELGCQSIRQTRPSEMTFVNSTRLRAPLPLADPTRSAFHQQQLTKIKDCGRAIATLQRFEFSGEPR